MIINSLPFLEGKTRANSPRKGLILQNTKVKLKLFYFFLFTLLICQYTYLLFQPIHPDEKVFIRVTEIWLQGGFPYKDIFDHKPPGIYLLAMPFVWLFDKPIASLRIFTFVIQAANALLLILVSQKLSNTSHSELVSESDSSLSLKQLLKQVLNDSSQFFIIFLYLALIPYYQGNFYLTQPFMMLFLLLSTNFLFESLSESDQHRPDENLKSSRNSKKFFLSALFFGLATFFRQTALVHILPIVIFLIYNKPKHKTYHKLVKLLTFGATAILPWLLFTAYAWNNNFFNQAWQQIVLFNLFSYPSLPIATVLRKIPLLVWPLVVTCVGYWLVKRNLFVSKEIVVSNSLAKQYLFFILLHIVVVLPLLLSRPYHHYWLQLIPWLFVIVGLKNFKNV